MKQFKFFRKIETYDDLGFFEKMEYDEGWLAAGKFLDFDSSQNNSPYDHDTRSRECWEMGWNDYMNLHCN